jgi:hypothetical protein
MKLAVKIVLNAVVTADSMEAATNYGLKKMAVIMNLNDLELKKRPGFLIEKAIITSKEVKE